MGREVLGRGHLRIGLLRDRAHLFEIDQRQVRALAIDEDIVRADGLVGLDMGRWLAAAAQRTNGVARSRLPPDDQENPGGDRQQALERSNAAEAHTERREPGQQQPDCQEKHPQIFVELQSASPFESGESSA